MNAIQKHFLPPLEEQPLFFEALYKFIQYTNSSYSAADNINQILQECDQILEKEKIGPDLWSGLAMEAQVDYLNDIFNKRKQFYFLKMKFEEIEPLLNQILNNKDFRLKLENELEDYLFEEPSLIDKILDIFVRVFGNHIYGWYKKY